MILRLYQYVFVWCAESGAARSTVPPADKTTTLRRVIDFVRETPDDNLRDINRKLQRVLEETLTKNIHLQKVGCSGLGRLVAFTSNSFVVTSCLV